MFNNENTLIKSLILSFLIVFLLFVWQGNKGFSLSDEGFLWYGVQRVIQGEVPMRDFMAYDPGRYYWSAAFMSLAGDSGVMSLRTAAALFQALGLFAGLVLVAQSAKSRGLNHSLFLMAAAVTLVLWMYPRHKIFDISISVFLIGALSFLVDKPGVRRYFFTGVCVGFAAFFGRNHGMYGLAGSLAAMLWLNIGRSSEVPLGKAVAAWAAGIVTGYSPMLVMLLWVPGFASAFFEGVLFLLGRGSTNLTLPIPWPWSVDFTALPLADAARRVVVGMLFLGTLVFGVLGIIWITAQRLRGRQVPAPFAACAFLALPYAHYAFSRADIGHLAQGIFPLLLGCLVLAAYAGKAIKWTMTIVLCAASFWIMQDHHPGWQCMAKNPCVDVEIAGCSLQVDAGMAKDIDLLRLLVDQYAPDGRSFIAAPFWPGAYALIERKAPMWSIYALWQRPPAFQEREVERIKSADPAFALVFDHPLDGREDLRFQNSHPIIFQYILEKMERLPPLPDSPYLVFKSRD